LTVDTRTLNNAYPIVAPCKL